MLATLPLTVQLPFTELRARYRVVSPFRLPHHSGSLLRGVLGRALRRTGCTHATSPCPDACAEPAVCAYSRLFDPPVPKPEPYKLLRGATHAPQPLLPLIPRPGSVQLGTGDTFDLGLRVLGRLDAQDEARLQGALKGITDFGLGRQEGRLHLDDVAVVGERAHVAELAQVSTSHQRAVVSFETPVWVETKGKLPEPLELPVLVRAIYRRLCTICALYGQLDEADDARVSTLDELAREARVTRRSLQKVRWERHSLERNRRHPMKGLWGTLEIEGELGELAGVLQLAEVVHVGKATSHGLGRIRVSLS